MVTLVTSLRDEVERNILPRHERDLAAAQRGADRVDWSYKPVYSLPARAGRIEAYAFTLGYMAHAATH